MARRRRSEPTAIGALLPRWLSRKGLRAEVAQYELWVRWPDLIGDRLAAHTEPGSLKDGKLVVRVSSAAWLHELSFLARELVQKINAGLGDERVRELRLMAGPVRPRRRARGDEPPAAAGSVERLSDAQLGEAELSAKPVEDEALREAVRRAAVARLRSKLG